MQNSLDSHMQPGKTSTTVMLTNATTNTTIILLTNGTVVIYIGKIQVFSLHLNITFNMYKVYKQW